MKEIPLDSLVPNPFATRYSQDPDIDGLAQSIKVQGQLESIGVRSDPTNPTRFQIIYGHRRVAAIRQLGFKMVRAEVKEAIDDRMMLQMAIVENLQRESLSDYEKGLLFRNLSETFRLSYEEIGRMIGKSKQLVSNHMAMTRLFSEDELKADQELRDCLYRITEAHTRVLSRIIDSEERKILLKIAVRDHLSAAELRALSGRPRPGRKEEGPAAIEWVGENARNRSDNSVQQKSRHGRVCILRVESLNYLISQLKVSAYDAGAQIAKGAADILRERGIEPRERRNWTSVLKEKSKYAGWGKISTTTNSKLVIHSPTINSEFLRGYLEYMLGIRLTSTKSNTRVQIFDIVSAGETQGQIPLFANMSV